MSWLSDDKSDQRHDSAGGRRVASSTDRLRLAPDDHSEMGSAGRGHQDNRKAPAVLQMFAASGAGADRHHSPLLKEGASSMVKRTRTPGLSDSGTQQSAVKITPATHRTGPVTTYPRHAMSSPAEPSSALTVNATAHRPSRRSPSENLCKFRGSLAERCPAWLEHRAKKTFRVEGWENNGWTMTSGTQPLPRGRAARGTAQGPLPQTRCELSPRRPATWSCAPHRHRPHPTREIR